MRRFFLPVLCTLVFVVSCKGENKGSAHQAQSEIIVEKADAARVMQAVEQHRDSVVLLNMWAAWCEPCVEKFPVLVELHNKYSDKGLVIIGVSHDFEDRIESDLIPFIRDQKANFTHFVQNGQTAQDFIDGIDPEWSGVLPATLIYDRMGRRAEYIPGMFDATILEDIVINLLDN